MKNRKRFFCLLTLALLNFVLLAGCGSSDKNEFDTDLIDDYGTVTRNGKQIDVCVCHDRKAIYFYYNDEEHELFDTAKLPTDNIYDKDWLLGNIILDDSTGDNNSDLQVYLEHSDMSESHIVWTWEEGTGYVYQPDYSRFHYPIVIYDPFEDTVNDFSMYEGLWLSDEENLYDNAYIKFDAEGNWKLYSGGEVIDEGYLGYESEEKYKDYYDKGSELSQRNVSAFQGAWYYDEELSAETFIIIDGDGNWSFFRRIPGDAEGTEIDHGTFTYSTDESSTYYADSAINDDVRYRVFEFDDDVLIWDEGIYYRME